MSCSCKNRKPSAYNPPEVEELLSNAQFSKVSSEDIMAFYLRFRDISSGQRHLNKSQFVELLNSFHLFPNTKVGDRLFTVVDRDNSGLIDFVEFMKYLFLLLDGSKDEKTTFVFKMIADKKRMEFNKDDLARFYKMVNSEDARSLSTSDDQLESTEAMEMATMVYDLMVKKEKEDVTLEEFTRFINVDPANVELFNFLSSSLEDSTKEIKTKKNYLQMVKMVEALESDLLDLYDSIFPGSADAAREQVNARRNKFSRAFQSLIMEKIKNKPEFLLKKSFKNIFGPIEDKKGFENPNQSGFNNTTFNRSSFGQAPGFQNNKESINPQTMESRNFQQRDTKKFDDRLHKLINGMRIKLEDLRDNIEKEIEASSKAEKLSDTIKHTMTKANDNKKVVFINDPNWNIVTSMVDGMQKSLNIVASDRFKSLTRANFKYHNTIQIEAMNSTKFDTCKFKDYAPYVFQSIRRQSGITYDDYIRSLGVNTFRNAFFDKLYLMLSESSTGKSGSFFFHTSDGKFMIKTIKKSEFQILMSILPHYHEHILNNQNTLITYYYGLHQMKCYNKGELIYDIYVIVMNNIFCLQNPELIEKVYDLKGSFFQRLTPDDKIQKNYARKDLNFVNEGMKINIPYSIKDKVLTQIDLDAAFLAKFNIIDYSLLLGVISSKNDKGMKSMFDYDNMPKSAIDKEKDKDKHAKTYYIESTDGQTHYYLGIIDTLTYFGAKKRAEFMTKRTFQGKDISCIPPPDYKKRFCNFMEEIIITDI